MAGVGRSLCVGEMMLKWKFWRFVIAFIPLFVTLRSNLSAPLEHLVLGSYDVRWHVSKNGQERSETIAVCNAGTKGPEQITVELDATPGAVADFESRVSPEEPSISFLDVISRTTSLWTMPGTNQYQTQAFLDKDTRGATLYGLEQALRQDFAQRLRSEHYDQLTINRFLSSSTSHRDALRTCLSASAPRSYCNIERALESWEQSVSRVYAEAHGAWESASGVSFSANHSYLSLKDRLYFHFPLSQGATRTLTIYYGAFPAQTATKVHAQNDSTRVDEQSQLGTNRWWILPRAKPLWTLLSVLTLFACLFFAWTHLTNVKALSTFEIFSLALDRENENVWQLAYERRGGWIEREFQHFCAVFGKGTVLVGQVELFDFIRSNFRVEHVLYDLKFDGKADLDSALRKHLRDLAIRA
jgi:hypothetical protein